MKVPSSLFSVTLSIHSFSYLLTQFARLLTQFGRQLNVEITSHHLKFYRHQMGVNLTLCARHCMHFESPIDVYSSRSYGCYNNVNSYLWRVFLLQAFQYSIITNTSLTFDIATVYKFTITFGMNLDSSDSMSFTTTYLITVI